MLWRNRRESNNVQDQRRLGGGTLGVGGLILGAVVYYLMGGNPLDYISQNSANIQRQEAPSAALNEDEKKFISVVLADTEDVWNSIFEQNGQKYKEPTLVLFHHMVHSACGSASSAMGPFYCPGDQQVYLDLSFFKQLSDSLGAKGDFAAAYVVAHEVGHHVQTLLGIEKSESPQSSVQVELQADCLAGVWAKRTQETKNVLEEGDIEEALNAASAVGDDKLQKASGREVVPDSFTHGTSSQRREAFKLGYGKGQPQECLTAYR